MSPFRQSLILSLLLTVSLIGCCTEAGLADYGNFGEDQQGFFRRCVTQRLIDRAAQALGSEFPATSLKADALEMQVAISRQSEFGICSEECLRKYYEHSPRLPEPAEKSPDKLIEWITIMAENTLPDYRKCHVMQMMVERDNFEKEQREIEARQLEAEQKKPKQKKEATKGRFRRLFG